MAPIPILAAPLGPVLGAPLAPLIVMVASLPPLLAYPRPLNSNPWVEEATGIVGQPFTGSPIFAPSYFSGCFVRSSLILGTDMTEPT